MVSEHERGLDECKQAVRISDQPQAGRAVSQWSLWPSLQLKWTRAGKKVEVFLEEAAGSCY